MSTIADRLFAAEREEAGLLSDLFEALCKRLGDDAIDDLGYDYYDRSIELLGCKPGLTLDEDALLYLHECGFERGWLNHTNGTETAFAGSLIGKSHPTPRPRHGNGAARLHSRLAASEQARERAEAEAAALREEKKDMMLIEDHALEMTIEVNEAVREVSDRLALAEKLIEASREFWKEGTDAQMHALGHALAAYDAVRAGGAE